MGITLRSFLLCCLLHLWNSEFAFATGNCSNRCVTPQYLEKLLDEKNYEKFCSILEIADCDLVRPSERVEYITQSVFFNGLPLGDILLTSSQNKHTFQHYAKFGYYDIPAEKWKDGILSYYIAKEYSAENVTVLSTAIQELNASIAPNVLLRPYEDGDKNYVFLFWGGKGCFSNLGRICGAQVISLSPTCLLSFLIKHEFLHTLGVGHEFNRFDRNEHIRILDKNIPENLKTQYIQYGPKAFVNLEEFDTTSVMFYPSLLPEKYTLTNITAIEPLEEGVVLSPYGNVESLSEIDIKKVKELYS